MRIEARPFKFSITNVYASTEKAIEEKKDNLYDKLKEELKLLPKEDTIIILRDLNAQISNEEYIKNVAETYTLDQ